MRTRSWAYRTVAPCGDSGAVTLRKGARPLHRRCRRAFTTLVLGVSLAFVNWPCQAMVVPGVSIYLFDTGGHAYQAVGYSSADSHVFDPDSVQIGEVDAAGNIWNEQATAIIGYVRTAGPPT